MKILVRATNWVGDAAMSLPAIRAIRERFPGAEIVVLARPWVVDLYARESSISRVISYRPKPGLRDWRAKWRLAQELRAQNFDWAILLQNAFEAALLVWLARIPRRTGYDRDARRWLLTEPIPVPRAGEIPRHERFYYLELLRRAGVIERLPDEPIRLEGAEAAARRGVERFVESGIPLPAIGLSPGAAYGTAKRWLPERFAESAYDMAKERGASIVIFGAPGERPLCESVAAQIRALGPSAYNVAGQTTLRAFIEMTAACSLFVTNDSGGMHIASALGVPTIAVFGATDHTATGPTGPLTEIVREPVECSPCLLRECPIDHRCMTRVTSRRVTQAALALWTHEPKS